MKKTIFILVFSLLLVLSAFSQGKPIITVLDFTANGIAESDANAIVSFLTSSVFETNRFRVIDKAQRDNILMELEFSVSGCADESCQLEIGKLLAAEYIIVGDVSRVGTRYILNAKMIETESSQTINTARGLFADMDELLDNIDSLALKLSDSGISEPQPEPANTAVGTDVADAPVKPEAPAVAETPAVAEAPAQPAAQEPKQAEPEAEEIVPEEVENVADILTEEEKTGGPDVRKIAAWSTLGIGAAAAAVGGYLIYDALAYKTANVDPAYNDVYLDDSPNYGSLTADEYFNQVYSEYLAVFDIFKGKSILALSVTGGGILSLAASALLFLLPQGNEDTELQNGSDKLSFNLQPGPGELTFLWKFYPAGVLR